MPVDAPGNYRIDWILFRGPFTCQFATLDTRRGPDELMPSDHYPVIATLEWTCSDRV
jgi:endonuclease/exonuclease/phosphatase family metal-dependent hydrolase